ncbi:hypothetical protein [Rhizobium sp. CSW-27]|uniref:hypothetical protein n=1 Tax=Rhizobium sp. CSW-27 TaxID=2839985 RepID=UPI001C010A07|nr:hypothetical protein [Rhizobium sp. CSW-27]MBT9370287.1 hypothetical protein [Rhizobium sp. CSW-27]
MATKPKAFRPCHLPSAEERERAYDRHRDQSRPGREFYKTHRWQRERADFLNEPENQLCRRCMAAGLLNAGQLRKDGTPQTDPRRMHLVVHHTVRHRGNPEIFWDRSKWEALCPDHHDIDAQAEERAAGRGGGRKFTP